MSKQNTRTPPIARGQGMPGERTDCANDAAPMRDLAPVSALAADASPFLKSRQDYRWMRRACQRGYFFLFLTVPSHPLKIYLSGKMPRSINDLKTSGAFHHERV
jgi:hypothetical protein